MKPDVVLKLWAGLSRIINYRGDDIGKTLKYGSYRNTTSDYKMYKIKPITLWWVLFGIFDIICQLSLSECVHLQ